MGGRNANGADLASIVGGPALGVAYVDFVVKCGGVVSPVEPFICDNIIIIGVGHIGHNAWVIIIFARCEIRVLKFTISAEIEEVTHVLVVSYMVTSHADYIE
jgi:hypothetical protein